MVIEIHARYTHRRGKKKIQTYSYFCKAACSQDDLQPSFASLYFLDYDFFFLKKKGGI